MAEEEKGRLTVIQKPSDIIENTIGRIGALETNIALLTPTAIWKSIPKERIEELQNRYKDIQWNGKVEVYLSHSPLFKQLARLFQKGRRVNLFARIAVGIPYTTLAWLSSKLSRADYYNPFTETVTTYHPNRAVGMHEIGHAEDFDKSKYPFLRFLRFATLPLVRSKIEWNASRNAMKYLQPEEKEEARRILEPAWGTYLAFDTAAIASLFYTPFRPLLAIAPIIGLIAGHIHARLPGSHNIFFNDKPIEEHIPVPSARLQPALIRA